ncbi:MAG: hypothetical protein ACR2LF_01035 [Jatrophihabitantaceae bacterium]
MPAFLRSELPLLASTRHHWIVLLRRPHPVLAGALLVMLLAALLAPVPMAYVLLATVVAIGLLRWQTWRAERMILTRTRIVRVRGVPETTSTEASVRLARISGAVLVQTVLGKILDYGSIEIDAPGRTDLRTLSTIAHPHEFYLQLRRVVFGTDAGTDGWEDPAGFDTSPLPVLPQPPPR